jgi:hypothetical protein
MIEADDVPDLQDLQALRTSIVANMRGVQLRAYDGNPESVAVVELPVPRPRPGQVLVSCPGDCVSTNSLLRIGVSPTEWSCEFCISVNVLA